METTPSLNKKDIFQKLLLQSKHPLICVPKNATKDIYASASALSLFLKQMEKSHQILITDEIIPSSVSFLFEGLPVIYKLEHIRSYLITIPTNQHGIKQIEYEKTQDEIILKLTPKQGLWETDQIKHDWNEFTFDLIISLGAKQLTDFGSHTELQREFFLTTTTINIDTSSENTEFGHENFVNIKHSCICEYLFALLFEKNDSPETISKRIAESLYCGILSVSKRFMKKPLTLFSSETLKKLLECGISQDEILEKLFKTHSIKQLRLKGRLLSRLQKHENIPELWISKITREDYLQLGLDSVDIIELLDELIYTSKNVSSVVIFCENPLSNITTYLLSQKIGHLKELFENHVYECKEDCLIIKHETKNMKEIEETIFQTFLKQK